MLDIRLIFFSTVETLVRKFRKYTKAQEERQTLLSGLNKSCTDKDRVRWTKELNSALEGRLRNPKVMDDFLDAADQGMSSLGLNYSKSKPLTPHEQHLDANLLNWK
jgi:hypothetical protein